MFQAVSPVAHVEDYVCQVVEVVWPGVVHHPIWDAFMSTVYRLHSGGIRRFQKNIEKSQNLKYKFLSRSVVVRSELEAVRRYVLGLAATICRTLKDTPPIHLPAFNQVFAALHTFYNRAFKLDEWEPIPH